MTATTNMVFSEATNKTGMYEWFQDLCQVNPTSYTAYKYARDANNALADYLMLTLKVQGQWQFDDSNQAAEAVISRNIVLGTYSYPITTDDETNANQVLQIERVECATESTADPKKFQVLEYYDEMDKGLQSPTLSITGYDSIIANRSVSGVPYAYAKRGNSIFLYPNPNFSATAGLKIFISRTTTYFAGTDTTKVAGIPQAHQKYLVLKPAYEYCAVNIPARANGILLLLNQAEKEIREYFSSRDKEAHKVMRGKRILYI